MFVLKGEQPISLHVSFVLDYPLFRSVDLNLLGRDYVVGDIHGAFHLVDQCLLHVGFNPEVDRLFSLGDMIDRGEESYKVLEFLSRPYVYAINGNHDYFFSTLALSSIRALGLTNEYGMQWVNAVQDDVLLEIKYELKKLPVAMAVKTFGGSVGLVHADIPAAMSWNRFIKKLEAGDPDVLATALEGRHRIKSKNHSGVTGIDRLFVGHSIQWDGPQQYGNVHAIDTGAAFADRDFGLTGRLTIIDMLAY